MMLNGSHSFWYINKAIYNRKWKGSGDQMLCGNCNKNNPMKNNFCFDCGETLHKKVTPRIRFSPTQKTYMYLELRIDDLRTKKEELSKKLNTPPEGIFGRFMGNNGSKVVQLKIRFMDERIKDLMNVHDMLGGAASV